MGEQENQEKQSAAQLSQLLATLTTDQIRFVIARQDLPSDKEAAKSVGIKPNTVSQWKHAGSPIDEAVRLMVFDGLKTALHLRKRSLARAMATKVEGLDSKSGRLRQSVATEIIEWEMGKATQRQEVGGLGGGPLQTQDVTLGATERNRAVVKLAEFITSQLHSDDTRPDDAMGTAEHPAVDGAAESSG